MSTFRAALMAATFALIALPGAAQQISTAPGDAREFLEQLAGEWSVQTEAIPGPGQDPVSSQGRETARMVGNWLVAEIRSGAQGRPYTGILTVGYSAHQGRFVATWIDSVQGHLWEYTGSLDREGAILTLETEGPLMGNPENMVPYREFIELLGPDRKVMRSQILGPDGEWFEFGRAEYRRVN
jgi:hypothetical protein